MERKDSAGLDLAHRERDRKIVEIVRHFLLATLTFRQQYQKYQQGDLRFNDLAKLVDDQGRSIFFTLKEHCHNLFRRNSFPISAREQIFDLTIGSMFHLAMKMREDLYQLEIYGPKYLALPQRDDSPSGQEDLIYKFKEIISRAEDSLREGMEEIAILAREVFRQFQELLKEYRENGLLARFLLEEKDLCQQVMGKDSVEGLFRNLYGPQEDRPFRLAGASYLQGAFYSQALRAFSKALEKSPGDKELQFKVHLCQGMEQFYAFALPQALKSLEKCLSLGKKVQIGEADRSMIRRICQKIQEDFPGRRKSDHHRDWAKEAKSLERQLDKLPSLPPPIPSLPPEKGSL